jgi:putative exosortase-associated protein (TIGR04073 family)
MKTQWLVGIGALLLATVSVFAAVEANTVQEESNVVLQARTADLWFEKWGFKMTRGFMNMATCWVELPRNLYVDTSNNAVVGPAIGFFKGVGLTVVRALAGVMDVATMGTVDDTYTIYDQYNFPYFVWQGWGEVDR